MRENVLNFDQENAGERDMHKNSTMYSAEDRIRRGGSVGGGRNREGAGILSRPCEKGRRTSRCLLGQRLVGRSSGEVHQAGKC